MTVCMLTPPEVGRRWRIKAERVISFIKSGQLRAMDVASPTSTRPRYRIDMAAVLEFESTRSGARTPKPLRRKKARQTDVVEFF
jgi:hypothetical protein